MVINFIVLRLFFPRQIVQDEPWRMVHHSSGLISSILAGEDKSTKNVPATTESTILLAFMLTLSILTMTMFLLLDEFWATSKLKSVGAS